MVDIRKTFVSESIFIKTFAHVVIVLYGVSAHSPTKIDQEAFFSVSFSEIVFITIYLIMWRSFPILYVPVIS